MAWRDAKLDPPPPNTTQLVHLGGSLHFAAVSQVHPGKWYDVHGKCWMRHPPTSWYDPDTPTGQPRPKIPMQKQLLLAL